MIDGSAGASEIASRISSGETTAREVIETTLARIASINPKVNAFTDITAERARQAADAVDGHRKRGEKLGQLAGVPFAVKNLIDIAGLPTRAGELRSVGFAFCERVVHLPIRVGELDVDVVDGRAERHSASAVLPDPD